MNVYVELSGGLGNQLFQYAQYLKLKKSHSRVNFKIFDAPIKIGRQTNQFERLTEFLKSTIDIEKSVKVQILFFFGRKIKLFSNSYFTYQDEWWSILNEFDLQELAERKNVLVKSLFQKKPDRDINNILRLEYQNAKDRREQCLVDSPYVAMHVRLGDYLTDQSAMKQIGPMSAVYYQNAHKLLKKMYPDLPLYIVTNGTDAQVAEILNGQLDSYRVLNTISDIASFDVLTGATAIAITNSSFSLWAAYLSQTDNVIAPPRWTIDPTFIRKFDVLYKKNWNIVSE